MTPFTLGFGDKTISETDSVRGRVPGTDIWFKATLCWDGEKTTATFENLPKEEWPDPWAMAWRRWGGQK